MIQQHLHPIMVEDITGIINMTDDWSTLRNSVILITGASGMVASYLLYTLIHLNDTKGLKIKLVVLLRDPVKLKLQCSGLVCRDDVTLVKQDICTPPQYEGHVDYIVHAASPANPHCFSLDPVGTIKANVIGTYNLLELARRNKARKFIFLSSAEVYGSLSVDRLITEDMIGILDNTIVRSCYPESKRLSETYCSAYMSQYGIPCHTVRMAHIYGPSLHWDDGHVIAEFLRNVIIGSDIVLRSDGRLERSYTYVADAVTGILAILLSGKEFVYNLGNEAEIISIHNLAQSVIDLEPQKGLKIAFDIPAANANTGFLPYNLGLISSNRLRGLGWAPKTTLCEGLLKTFLVFKHNNEHPVGDDLDN